MTNEPGTEIDARRLLGVDPEHLSRPELIALVRDLQGALSARLPQPAPQTMDKPRTQPVSGADYTIVFDGGSLGNPGRGYGSYEITGPHGTVAARKLEFGDAMTNNQAEFHALIAALESVLAMNGRDAKTLSLAVRGDSQLVIRGLKGEWRIKHPGLQPLHRRASELLRQFGSVDLAWHPRAASVRAFGH